MWLELTIYICYGTIWTALNVSRGGAVAARVAHNHEVPGSSPGPATKKRGLLLGSPFSF